MAITLEQIAKQVGVSRGTVEDVYKRQGWKTACAGQRQENKTRSRDEKIHHGFLYGSFFHDPITISSLLNREKNSV